MGRSFSGLGFFLTTPSAFTALQVYGHWSIYMVDDYTTKVFVLPRSTITGRMDK